VSRRILFTIGSGAVGGAEGQLARLSGLLVAAGWEPRVHLFRREGPLVQVMEDAGVPVYGPPPRASSASTAWRHKEIAAEVGSWGRSFRGHVRQFDPAVVHAILPGAVWMSNLALAGRRQLAVAGVRGSRGDGHRGGRLYPLALRSADLVVCNARHLGVEVVDKYGVDPGRVRVVPNGVELPDWVADPGVEPPRGVVVANFQTYKGYDVLLEALARVEVPLVVHLCGGGDRSWFVARAAELGVSGRVVFVDQPADVPAELRVAQFAVHPSRTEGLSNAVLEEMAAGLPVVASDVGGLPTLVDHGVNGLLVPPGDPVALAEALTRMVVDRGMRERMGAAARERAESFSWAACVQAHVDLYEELLEQHR